MVTYEATNHGIRQAVQDIAKTVYLTPSEVDNFHRCLIITVHADSVRVWKKATWR
jgi:hypothetical protein